MTDSWRTMSVDEAAYRFIGEHARGLLDPGFPHTLVLNTDLKTLLGCPYISKNEHGTDFMVRPGANRFKLAEVRQCLPAVLDAIVDHRGHADDIASLLAGVDLIGSREIILASESNAYTLAAALVYFMEPYDSFNAILHIEAMPRVCAIMNAWIKPAAPLGYGEPSSPRELCRLLFGDAWCDFVLVNVKGRDVVSFVRQARPPFLPGLCPAQDASIPPGAQLPDLGMAP